MCKAAHNLPENEDESAEPSVFESHTPAVSGDAPLAVETAEGRPVRERRQARQYVPGQSGLLVVEADSLPLPMQAPCALAAFFNDFDVDFL